MVLAAYVATAMLIVPSLFVAAEWIGRDDLPHPFRRLGFSVLAAALWPLLAVGLVQFAVIAAVRHGLVSRVPASTLPVVDEADTVKLPRLTVPYVRVRTI